MSNEKTSVLNNGMIWFGAAVSIAEIYTGTLLAPLGFARGAEAIVLGHIIGCLLLLAAGLIGADTRKSAMETVKISFGSRGALLFSVLNILQLVGWTAIMIISGARATGVIANPVMHLKGEALWCILIALLIMVWILIGLQNLSTLNVFTMSALFLLTIILSVVVFHGSSSAPVPGSMSFGAGVELAAAMPLSWLPLISDYTSRAKSAKSASSVSVLSYFLTSCWMYIIGLGAALYTGQTDIALIMVRAGLGLAGVIIVIFSTVTTTFLDAYSAGVSFATVSKKIKIKWTAVIICVAGAFLAILTPIEEYENFLYLIGSVFAPMIAILITDYFILKKDHTPETVNITNLILWAVGFAIYRWFMSIDTVVGSTLPVMIIIVILCLIVNGGRNYVRSSSGKR